jgi:hypothetical protein
VDVGLAALRELPVQVDLALCHDVDQLAEVTLLEKVLTRRQFHRSGLNGTE